MTVLPRLLALIPVAQAVLWVMILFAAWTFRDLLLARRAAAAPRLRWKLAVLSSLAATELVLCLVGVLSF